MKAKLMVAAAAMSALAACGGGDNPVVEADTPGEPAVAVPESGGGVNGYIGRANDVASDLEDHNAGLEGLTP